MTHGKMFEGTKQTEEIFKTIKKISFYDYSAVFGFLEKQKIKDKISESHYNNLIARFIFYYHFQNDDNPKQRRITPPLTISESSLVISLIGKSYFIKQMLKYKKSNKREKIVILSDIYNQVDRHKIPNCYWGHIYYQVKPKFMKSIKRQIKYFLQVIQARKTGKPLYNDKYWRKIRRESGLGEYFREMIKRGLSIQI